MIVVKYVRAWILISWNAEHWTSLNIGLLEFRIWRGGEGKYQGYHFYLDAYWSIDCSYRCYYSRFSEILRDSPRFSEILWDSRRGFVDLLVFLPGSDQESLAKRLGLLDIPVGFSGGRRVGEGESSGILCETSEDSPGCSRTRSTFVAIKLRFFDIILVGLVETLMDYRITIKLIDRTRSCPRF